MPLVSSDGVKAECLRGALSGRGIAPNCYSSSVSLPASICLPLSVRPSVLLALCPPQALCVCSPARRSLCGDLMPVRAFSLLVLCVALRKCSTPRSAGSGREDGEGGEVGDWRGIGARPASTLYLGPPFMSLSFCAVKLHWTVEELSHHTHRGW